MIGLVAHDYKAAMEVIDRALTLTGASATALWMGSVILAHAGDSRQGDRLRRASLRIMPFGRESSFALWRACDGLLRIGRFRSGSRGRRQGNPGKSAV